MDWTIAMTAATASDSSVPSARISISVPTWIPKAITATMLLRLAISSPDRRKTLLLKLLAV
nr:hypothetical protein [Cryobacterium sp. TMT2-4]